MLNTKNKYILKPVNSKVLLGAEIIILCHIYFCAERKKYETCPKIPRFSIF